MENNDHNLSDALITKLGLTISDQQVNAPLSPNARVFNYPHLEDVYVMESDLYGNPMPQGSCFLAFNGKHGMIGKHLKIETLIEKDVNEIRKMVEANSEG